MPIDGRMIAGAPLTYWIGFHAVVLLLLVIDLVVLGRRPEGPRFRTALVWTAVPRPCWPWPLPPSCLRTQGQEHALEFLSGYVLEGSLSIDNLFVFLVLFRNFGLTVDQQHRALSYGVLGAIVLRAVFIVAGVALLDRFEAMQYIFGALLLYAAWRLIRPEEGPRGASIPRAMDRSPWLACVANAARRTHHRAHRCDLRDRLSAGRARCDARHFIVYTSNIFAILGLRSLYFVLQGLLHQLHLLHYGLAVILAFVGGKMIAARWFEIPTIWSLAHHPWHCGDLCRRFPAVAVLSTAKCSA